MKGSENMAEKKTKKPKKAPVSKQPKKQRQNLEFRKIDGTDKKSLGI